MITQRSVTTVSEVGVAAGRASAVLRRSLTVAWAFLLVLGAFFVVAALSDLAADLRIGLPVDHTAAFGQIVGSGWASAAAATPGLAHYITLLEVAYAVHELVFGLLFLVIVAIPFRRRMHWAWWACWAPLLANLVSSLTFGRHDPTLLARSLIGDVGLPLVLLLHVPAFFQRSRLVE